ncbi:MAG: hypothetical protein A2055_00260 [Deltaproteobacteria bacterium GWA2_47_9]|nr:MAG: hypothetical protein A2055_00260 [Deltaproteobacteria bacterium GWA2_47_9]
MKLAHPILLLICLSLSCQKYSGPSNPEPLVPEKPMRLSVSPTYCVVGSVITLSDTGFYPYSFGDTLKFTGNVEILADSGSSTTLYARIPFGAFSGYLSVRAPNYQDSVQITVLESYDPKAFAMRWYNLDVPITSQDAVMRDPLFHAPYYWTVTKQSDTVKFYVEMSYPNGWDRITVLFQDNGPGNLPKLLLAEWKGFPGYWIPQPGLLKIQDWDTSSIVSAIFFTDKHNVFDNVALWHDFRQ